MVPPSRIIPFSAAAAALLLSASPARADRIDGNWCHGDGRHFSIDGPTIVTPGGTRMTGNYDRHGFEYTVPEGETGAGSRVVMRQLNETTVEVMTITTATRSPWVMWRRCDLTT